MAGWKRDAGGKGKDWIAAESFTFSFTHSVKLTAWAQDRITCLVNARPWVPFPVQEGVGAGIGYKY